MKTIRKYVNSLKTPLCLTMVCLLAFGLGEGVNRLPQVLAQSASYRYGPGGIIYAGANGGDCFEPTPNAGVDSCIGRVAAGQIGTNLGSPNSGWAFVPQPPVPGLATATTGGTIPDGTSYRLAITYVTPTAGETNVTSAVETTQTTTGGGLSTITVTAPIAAAGVAGYRVYSTNASGVGNSNTTLTELLQPITTTVCAGAFQVSGSGGPGTGPMVCPIGTNAVFTSLVFTAAGNAVPNIPGTAGTVPASGTAIPTQNTAAYPAAIPDMIANLVQMPTRSTITTIQAFGTIPLFNGVQNVSGKVMRITGHGRYTSGAQTGTMTISTTEGGITPMTVTSAAIITGGQTNAQFSFDYYLTTNKTGTAGTLWGHGQLCVNLQTAANTSALSCSNDALTAVSSAIDLTAQNNLAINITMSASTTSATLDDAQVWLLN